MIAKKHSLKNGQRLSEADLYDSPYYFKIGLPSAGLNARKIIRPMTRSNILKIGSLYKVKNAEFSSDGQPLPPMAVAAVMEHDGFYSPYGEVVDLIDDDIALVLPLENNYSTAEVVCLLNERIVFIRCGHLQPI